MRGTRLTPLLLGALAMLVSACGASSQDNPSNTLQSNLRALASGAPAGDHAYWLGPQFHGATVRFANPDWGRYAILTYARLSDVDIDVESLRPGVAGRVDGFAVRVRTAGGQRVLLVFHVPKRPSTALIRSAEAALQPIPPHLTYPG
jgi:hypothetical protein